MQYYSLEAIQKVQHFYWKYLDEANKRKGLKDLYNVKDEKMLSGLNNWLQEHRNDFQINKPKIQTINLDLLRRL